MPRRQLSYADLRVGLFVLLGTALLIVGIFYVTGAGAFESKYVLRTYVPEAEGLVTGAPVTLGGVQIGTVRAIRINEHATSPAENIEIEMEIYRRFREWIRMNSTASLITQGLLGSRYVTITRGTPPAPVVPPGGVVVGRPETTTQAVVERSAELLNNLNQLASDVRTVVETLHQGRGTLGKLLNDPSLYNHLNATVARADRLIGRVEQGQGTVGKLLISDELYQRADSAIGRLDDLLAGVHNGQGTVGRLLQDPSLYNNANAFFQRGNTLLGSVESGQGSLGKLVQDPALYNNLRDASANLRDLTGKLNQGEGSVGKFFTDPQLYQNLTALTGDLRLLIDDFRRNPKKYLRIRVTIF